jgi:hypothetical protein
MSDGREQTWVQDGDRGVEHLAVAVVGRAYPFDLLLYTSARARPNRSSLG